MSLGGTQISLVQPAHDRIISLFTFHRADDVARLRASPWHAVGFLGVDKANHAVGYGN